MKSMDEIARRAQCELALLVRQQIEDGLALGQRMEGPVDRLLRFLEEEALPAGLDDDEAALLGAAPGRWDPREVREVAWRIERLAVYLWALGRLELSPMGIPMDADEVWGRIALMGPTAALVEGAAPPAAEALDRARRAAGVWRWRVETELKRRGGGRTASGEDSAAMIARAAERAAGLVEVAEGDLVVDGEGVAALGDARLREVASVVLEREAALSWLSG